MSSKWMRVACGALIAVGSASLASAGGNGGVRASARPVAGEYLVVLEDSVADVDAAARDMATRHGLEILHVYRHALKGFAARMPEVSASAVSRNPRVEYVEENGRVELFQSAQLSLAWGLDRIDQRGRTLNGSYSRISAGVGVRVYVIDTGIRGTHQEFDASPSDPTSRVDAGFDAFGGDSSDCNGHGTHVAATAGGLYSGAAPGVYLTAVRVLDCGGSGTTGGVMAGVDWVTGDHAAGTHAVANMSLGGPTSGALDRAVRNSINDGIAYVVAAGNSNIDACSTSPARVGPAITVGATTKRDVRAFFSNWGSCVDIFAPGVGIQSAWFEGDSQYRTISGTSMAAPHVAGVAALYLEFYASGEAPPAVATLAITRSATMGRVADPAGSPNRLLFSLISQRIIDPSFESSSWSEIGPVPIQTDSTANQPYHGDRYAWLGGLGTTGTMSLSQAVSMYTPATSTTLTFFLRVRTAETTTRATDKLLVEVYDETGTTLLKRLATYSNLNAGSTYKAKSFNLLAFQGQNVQIVFRSVENGPRATSFLVDSVALNVGQE